MVSRHVKVHVDNYERSTDVSTIEGKVNLDTLSQADVIYFNGGDQSRHVRCWFKDDGQPNDLFKIIVERVKKNLVVLVGVSAGTAIQSSITYGGGSSFGILYFTSSVGLAPKSVKDFTNGSGLEDLRNGTEGLQY